MFYSDTEKEMTSEDTYDWILKQLPSKEVAEEFYDSLEYDPEYSPKLTFHKLALFLYYRKSTDVVLHE